MSLSFKMKSKMECWNVIANESQPIVLFNGSPRNQIIVIVSPNDILSWNNSFPMHNVYFVQYIFPQTVVQTYPKICVLVSHLTYICPSLFECTEVQKSKDILSWHNSFPMERGSKKLK